MSPSIPFSGLPSFGQSANVPGLTGNFPLTVLMNAPHDGLYILGINALFTATDGAGTLTVTPVFPDTPTAQAGGINAAPPVLNQTASATAALFLKSGDRIQVSATASGFVSTTWTLIVALLELYRMN